MPSIPPETVTVEIDAPPRTPMGAAAITRWFLGLLRPHGALVAIVGVLMTIQLGFTLATPTVIRLLFDSVIPQKDFDLLLKVSVGLAIAFVIGLSGKVVLDRTVSRIVSRIVFDLSRRLFHQVTRLSSQARRSLSNGDLLARFTSDMTQVEQALQVDVTALAQSLFLLVGCLVAAFYVDWRMTLVALIATPVALIGAHLVSPKVVHASTRHKDHQARLAEIIEEGLGAQSIIRAFGLERYMDDWFAQRGRKVATWGAQVSFFSQLMGGLAYYGVMFLLVSVMLAGATLTMLGLQTAGVMMACLLLLIEVGNAVAVVSLHVAALNRISGAVGRIEELASLPFEEDPDNSVVLPRLQGSIEMRGVRFGYDGASAPVLDDLNLSLPAGRYCALVGGSGSGKSTILRLLMGLEQPLHGEIQWDGTPITPTNAAAVRAHIGFVPQEPLLFDLPLRENIRLGRMSATDAEIEAAARAAEIHDTISNLPQGYDTRAGGRGGNLSGGQRQRIAIARALVRDPAILVLDEATSALDARTEADINNTIQALARTRMIVNVTHRIESICNADRIFVLERGRLEAEGTHTSLVETSRVYHELYTKQGGFVADEDGLTRVDGTRLRQIPLFANLSDAQLDQLSTLFYSVHFAAGDTILREGATGERFMLIARGRVEVSCEGTTLAHLEEGDYFGEISLLRNGVITATCTASWPTTCLALSRQHFQQHLMKHDELRAPLQREMELRLAALVGHRQSEAS